MANGWLTVLMNVSTVLTNVLTMLMDVLTDVLTDWLTERLTDWLTDVLIVNAASFFWQRILTEFNAYQRSVSI